MTFAEALEKEARNSQNAAVLRASKGGDLGGPAFHFRSGARWGRTQTLLELSGYLENECLAGLEKNALDFCEEVDAFYRSENIFDLRLKISLLRKLVASLEEKLESKGGNAENTTETVTMPNGSKIAFNSEEPEDKLLGITVTPEPPATKEK